MHSCAQSQGGREHPEKVDEDAISDDGDYVLKFLLRMSHSALWPLILPLLSTLHVDHGVLPHQVNAKNLDMSCIQKQMILCHISFIQQQIT